MPERSTCPPFDVSAPLSVPPWRQRQRTLANEFAPFEGAIRDPGDALHDEPTDGMLGMLSVLPFADDADEGLQGDGRLGRTSVRGVDGHV